MTTAVTVIEELRQRVADLETRVRDLEAVVTQNGIHKADASRPNKLLTLDEIMASMRSKGLIRDPLPEELELAARWDARPEEEKREIEEELRNLKLDPPLSEIINMNRDRYTLDE